MPVAFVAEHLGEAMPEFFARPFGASSGGGDPVGFTAAVSAVNFFDGLGYAQFTYDLIGPLPVGIVPVQFDTLALRAVEQAVMRALFPRDDARRAFLSAVGAPTAMAALASIFPMAAAKEAFAQSQGPLEKRDLKVGFIAITCATPIIMAQPMGFYSKQGLNVEVIKTAGWAVIRDKTLNKEYDAAHMLSPMPLAISLGLGAAPQAYTMPAEIGRAHV